MPIGAERSQKVYKVAIRWRKGTRRYRKAYRQVARCQYCRFGKVLECYRKVSKGIKWYRKEPKVP